MEIDLKGPVWAVNLAPDMIIHSQIDHFVENFISLSELDFGFCDGQIDHRSAFWRKHTRATCAPGGELTRSDQDVVLGQQTDMSNRLVGTAEIPPTNPR
jgi:hypothetical protein